MSQYQSRQVSEAGLQPVIDTRRRPVNLYSTHLQNEQPHFKSGHMCQTLLPSTSPLHHQRIVAASPAEWAQVGRQGDESDVSGSDV